MTQGKGRTGTATVGVWLDEVSGAIHVSLGAQGLSTVNADPASKRGHPHLYNKLGRLLRDQGMPHPAVVEDRDHGRGR